MTDARRETTRALAGRVALVTGVSRRLGIAPAIVRRLRAAGATVFATGWAAHDDEMPWGSDPAPIDDIECESRDLADPEQPTALIDAVVERFGALDIVVAVHARSSQDPLASTSAADLDACWKANVRSVVLLAQRFAAVHDATRPGGRMIWFTSGQHLQPMPGEIAYAISKGALHMLTPTLAEPLGHAGIVANCINPGPTDTGYAESERHAAVASMFPEGRWGSPDDVADLVEFLVSDRGGWIRGQVLNTEGGFDRFR